MKIKYLVVINIVSSVILFAIGFLFGNTATTLAGLILAVNYHIFYMVYSSHEKCLSKNFELSEEIEMYKEVCEETFEECLKLKKENDRLLKELHK